MNARADDHWQYGTTLHEMVEEVDSGSIIDRAFVDIYEDDTARTLYDRTRDASISLFEQWLPAIADKSILEQTTPQDEFDGERYFYTKESLNDLFCIDADRLAVEDQTGSLAVYDQIRALEFPPLDPAYTEIAGKKVHLTTQLTEDE
jgi:methionyl-tRNA formyltransferase